MESNFIEERIVIRERIIKNNLKLSRGGATHDLQPPSTSRQVIKTPSEKVIFFEELVNEGLKQDLVDISKQVDVVCETIADYLKIKQALKILKQDPRSIRVQTNLGCNFYAQCDIDDSSKVYLCVGNDYYLYMTLDEAFKMLDFKEKQWMKILDGLQMKACKFKAYIKIALNAMSHLYETDQLKPN